MRPLCLTIAEVLSNVPAWAHDIQVTYPGGFMSNVDKMCLRLMAVCFLPIIFAVPIAMGVSAFDDAFAHMGAPPMSADLPWLITLVAAAICVVLFAIQGTRIWRWKEGQSLSCPNCGCLLGGIRDGQWGPYRKCLGCRTNHAER